MSVKKPKRMKTISEGKASTPLDVHPTLYINSASLSVCHSDSNNWCEIAQKCTFFVKFPGVN